MVTSVALKSIEQFALKGVTLTLFSDENVFRNNDFMKYVRLKMSFEKIIFF